MNLWRDHSLSIVLAVVGVVCIVAAFRLEPGKWFDLWLTFGGGLLTVSLFYAAAGFLKERNRPEDDPEW